MIDIFPLYRLNYHTLLETELHQFINFLTVNLLSIDILIPRL